jgi:hypothetical protein
VARADAPPHRAVFALVVTNNHSAELGRPDLHYADDDGVKYAEVFRMLAPEGNVHLLTELDRDSALLFPHLRGKLRSPTRAEVAAAAASIAGAAAGALRSGAEVEFYFVFAGHGDVDHGKGFLELRDGRFTSEDVEKLLKSIPSTRSHVILDSCNSFFVLNSRKPGGRRVVVADEAAKELRERLPNVGVFLSTSAEAEVFEWSELQSGIFSHAVRSGITGAADANKDGVVSYEELRAFVDLASSTVKNPLYRPRVFARGPRGRGDQPIFTLGGADARRVELDAAPRVRVTVRDVDDLPWIDAHKEEGAPMVLWLPARVAARASVEELAAGGDERAARQLLRRDLTAAFGPDPAQPIRLADVAASTPAPRRRGADEVLRTLFATPFGPRALAEYQRDAANEEEPVYGIAREDVERMRLLLGQVAGIERRDRIGAGAGGIGGGTLLAGLGVWLRTTPVSTSGRGAAAYQGLSYGAMGLGALGIGLGTFKLVRPSVGEKIYDDFVAELDASGGRDAAPIVARTESRLFQLAEDYRMQRRIALGGGIAFEVLSIGGFAALVYPKMDPFYRQVIAAYAAMFGVVGGLTILTSYSPMPVERLVTIWKTDPSLTRVPRLSLTPVVGLGSAGIAGTF